MTYSAESFWSYYRLENKQSTQARLLRDRLMLANQGLARKIAHRWAGQCAEAYEDLEQYALIGLSKAVERFNPGLGKAFSSFAVPYIRGEILHFLRDHGTLIKVPRRARETVASVRKDQQRLAALGRVVTDEQVAAAKGISKHKWQWTKDAVAFRPIENLDELRHLSDEEAVDGAGRLALHKTVHQELAKLPKAQRTCLVEFFFKQLSEEVIASSLSTTADQVRAWIQEGLDKLKGTSLAEAINQ